uniref:CHAT4 n=1 Tax=Pinus tabuliformis TaxID=88731 RepID=A0A0K0M799_PINTB|nr:CHAT4 [Pinus tabuliformis]
MAVLSSTTVRQAAGRLAAYSSSGVLCALPRTPPNFTITRQPPLFVAPDRPTPRQSLDLSNIDDQRGLRYHIPKLLFYRSDSDSSKKKNEKDPVKVVKEALAKVLVHYYPFAGRLRNADNGKLTVECTGEGVLFVEADADISLEDFGDLYPPIPRGDEFINNVPGSENITDSPLLLVQVTRLRCGGFVLGLRSNHCMSDGVGIAQFIKAMAEMARGAASPVVPPVWNREILRPREKPIVEFPHPEYDQPTPDEYKQLMAPQEEMSINKSFFFGLRDIDALKRQVEGSNCTTFEALSACLWQSRTEALKLPADQDLKMLFALNARSRFQPPLPAGYYGNAISFACAEAKVGDLTHQPLSFAVNLINEAKRRIDDKYLRSAIDLMEVKGRPHFAVGGSYIITDLSKVEYGKADFGWGKAVYGGFASGVTFGVSNFSVPLMKHFQGIVAPVCLPPVAMEKFEEIIGRRINY